MLLLTLWNLARPKLMPFVLLLPVVGFGWGHWDRALTLRGEKELLWVMGAWACLQSGTLWLNAALDRDQGEVLLGRSTPVPDHLVLYGYAALTFGVVFAFTSNSGAGVAGTVSPSWRCFIRTQRQFGKPTPFLGQW